MNEIFIILDNSYSFVNLIFENYKNEFIFHDKKYNFNFIEKNKLKVYDNSESYILDTLDSFIYTNNLKYITDFKLIELNNNEWFDQALLNNKTKEIIRIRDRNQFGKFEIKNDELIINWDHWGYEKFIKYDDDIYNTKSLNLYEMKEDIMIFMHICNINDGLNIFKKQIKKIIESNIYDNLKKIYVCWLGEYNNIKLDKKIEIIKLGNDVTYYEFLTINKMKEIIDNEKEEYKVLYLHNKGTRKAGNEKVIESWRDMMEYFLVEQGLYCYKNLEFFDTIGCNIINEGMNELSSVNDNHNYHYSGNFWWSKSNYIKNLNYLKVPENSENRIIKRYQCENWILSNMEKRNIGIIYQDNTNIHPYHRFIFNNYKNKKLLIKKLNN